PVTPRPFLIGLTGDVGAGKSTVRGWLEAQGAAALDADAVVHALLAPGGAAVRAVIEAFGPAFRGADGGIDRRALAVRVFEDRGALTALEGLLHPMVREATDRWLAACTADVAVVEAVKLIESGMAARCDAVWLVVADGRVRAERVRMRGWDDAEVARRLQADAPFAPRLARATEVIDNTGDADATAVQLARAWRRMLQG
ncbi:MAG: dephospho-CoA kinase, partial [Ardenticatenales bacterium]